MTTSGRLIFFLTVYSVLLGLQFLALYTFRKFLKRKLKSKILINLITITPFVIFNIPFIWAIFNSLDFSSVPKWLYNSFIMPFFVFQGAVLTISIYLLAGKIIKLIWNIPLFILKRFRIIREKIEKLKTRKAVIQYDKSRRAFITAGAAFVSGYAFIGSGLGVIDKDRYDITYKDIKIKNLPEELNGTTISLIRDIHSGPFMDVNLMKDYCDVVNSLNSDIIVIPGDLTNTKKTEIHPFNKAFSDLKARYGVYGTLGNHDYFSDPDYIANAISNESPVKMLRNKTEFINIKGKELCLIGIEDIRDSGTTYGNVLIEYIDKTLEETDEKYKSLPKILLCHKPYIFRDIKDRNIDLMLSGHTHGGQIVFAKFGNVNLSIAATVSNLISGLYKEGDSNLYVSRGIGTVGFPMRLNCPPEITQIKLKSN
jgi:predicted MPP superfamily phosphohydrolase